MTPFRMALAVCIIAVIGLVFLIVQAIVSIIHTIEGR